VATSRCSCSTSPQGSYDHWPTSRKCGGVATATDFEATTRILSLLDREIGRRRTARGGDGSSRLDKHHERILVLIDGYTSLLEALTGPSGGQEQSTDEWLTMLNRIVFEGRQVGIHVVITADRAASIRSSVMAAVTSRAVLRQPDDNEARELGAPSTRNLPPGGGYLGGLRFQISSIASREGITEAAALKDLLPSITGRVPSHLQTTPLPNDHVWIRRAAVRGCRQLVPLWDLGPPIWASRR
jgi:DNA segregation ATPase FtsK/SpoIIIE, S-DNA-T family